MNSCSNMFNLCTNKDLKHLKLLSLKEKFKYAIVSGHRDLLTKDDWIDIENRSSSDRTSEPLINMTICHNKDQTPLNALDYIIQYSSKFTNQSLIEDLLKHGSKISDETINVLKFVKEDTYFDALKEINVDFYKIIAESDTKFMRIPSDFFAPNLFLEILKKSYLSSLDKGKFFIEYDNNVVNILNINNASVKYGRLTQNIIYSWFVLQKLMHNVQDINVVQKLFKYAIEKNKSKSAAIIFFFSSIELISKVKDMAQGLLGVVTYKRDDLEKERKTLFPIYKDYEQLLNKLLQAGAKDKEKSYYPSI
jgi:hypothetical protein